MSCLWERRETNVGSQGSCFGPLKTESCVSAYILFGISSGNTTSLLRLTFLFNLKDLLMVTILIIFYHLRYLTNLGFKMDRVKTS